MKNNVEYEAHQVKVFSRWLTNVLKPKNIVIQDCTKECSDGIAFINCLEILTGKPAPRKWDKVVRFPVHRAQNCELAVQMVTNENIKLVGISGKDLADMNSKLTLGFVWTLILNFSINNIIQKDPSSPKTKSMSVSNALMQWARDSVKNYKSTNDFKNLPSSLCALIDANVPNIINYDSLNLDDQQALAQTACQACEQLNIPVFLDWEDLINGVDDKALMTQLAAMKFGFMQYKEKNLLLETPISTDCIRVESYPREIGPNFFKIAENTEKPSDIVQLIRSRNVDPDGILRFSLKWNDYGDFDENDLDAHCILPNGNEIYFSRKKDEQSGGELNIDIINPERGQPAVENITWRNKSQMPDGKYQLYVHNYCYRNGHSGFIAEISVDNQVYTYTYRHTLSHGQKVPVADVTFQNGQFSIHHHLNDS